MNMRDDYNLEEVYTERAKAATRTCRKGSVRPDHR